MTTRFRSELEQYALDQGINVDELTKRFQEYYAGTSLVLGGYTDLNIASLMKITGIPYDNKLLQERYQDLRLTGALSDIEKMMSSIGIPPQFSPSEIDKTYQDIFARRIGWNHYSGEPIELTDMIAGFRRITATDFNPETVRNEQAKHSRKFSFYWVEKLEDATGIKFKLSPSEARDLYGRIKGNSKRLKNGAIEDVLKYSEELPPPELIREWYAANLSVTDYVSLNEVVRMTVEFITKTDVKPTNEEVQSVYKYILTYSHTNDEERMNLLKEMIESTGIPPSVDLVMNAYQECAEKQGYSQFEHLRQITGIEPREEQKKILYNNLLEQICK